MNLIFKRSCKQRVLLAAVLGAFTMVVMPTVDAAGNAQNDKRLEVVQERIQRSQSTVSTSVGGYTYSERSHYHHSGSYIGLEIGSIINPYRNAPELKLADQVVTITNSTYAKEGVLGIFRDHGKYGVLGINGEVLIPAQYKDLETGLYGNFKYKDGKATKYMDKNGKEISTAEDIERSKMENAELAKVKAELAQYQTTYPSDEYEYFQDTNKKYGFKNKAGEVVIEPQFKDIITYFSSDRAFVKNKEGKIVAIDGNGQEVFTPPSKDVSPFDDNGLAEYRRKVSGFNFGSLLGFIGGGTFSGHGWGYNGYGVGGFTYDGVKRGYMNTSGDIVIDSKNDAVWPMTRFGTIVKNQGKTGFMNRDGQYIIQPNNYETGEIDQYNGLLVVKNKDLDKTGIFSIDNGQQVVPFVYDDITFAGTKRMLATLENTKYLVDMETGEAVFTTVKDDMIDGFGTDVYTWVHKGHSKYRIIDMDGNILFTDDANVFSDVKTFTNGHSAVKVNGKWGVVDMNGNWVVQPVYDNIETL